ncbi:hypothetical protein [Noviherbaspirillum aerium]|uniref:hypothetical protein n=1 Tax=Noviherbaspirillum aerium TaxID=2588497 RepID=UPI00124F6AFB|nr:hypothetical protein [Noviherbaspirillum aerium]
MKYFQNICKNDFAKSKAVTRDIRNSQQKKAAISITLRILCNFALERAHQDQASRKLGEPKTEKAHR